MQVVVLVCCYNGRAHLPELLTSLRESETPGIDLRIVVVDNASTDGSGDYICDHFCDVDVVRIEPNRGFTGGNNAGYAHVVEHYADARYLVLLNVDTIVEENWLRPLVDAMEADARLGAVQPLLLLHPDMERINTAGNRSHFLGFGMMSWYGERSAKPQAAGEEMDFPSGAAVMLRMDVLARVGLFDEAFYMYLEDADLGWKLRQAGLNVQLVPASIVYHKYEPTAPVKYYRHLERNRWLLLLTYYRWRTLMLLLPALLMMEAGQLFYALTQGAPGAKLASWRDLLRPTTWRLLRARRRAARARRAVSDREFMARFTGSVHLPTGDPWPLRCVANPLFEGYWRIVRALIRW